MEAVPEFSGSFQTRDKPDKIVNKCGGKGNLMDRVKDKVVIVTGGAGGLGKAEALLLAKEGAKVAIVARTETPLKSGLPGTILPTALSEMYLSDH